MLTGPLNALWRAGDEENDESRKTGCAGVVRWGFVAGEELGTI
jgi:hypothetical protein